MYLKRSLSVLTDASYTILSTRQLFCIGQFSLTLQLQFSGLFTASLTFNVVVVMVVVVVVVVLVVLVVVMVVVVVVMVVLLLK